MEKVQEKQGVHVPPWNPLEGCPCEYINYCDCSKIKLYYYRITMKLDIRYTCHISLGFCEKQEKIEFEKLLQLNFH